MGWFRENSDLSNGWVIALGFVSAFVGAFLGALS